MKFRTIASMALAAVVHWIGSVGTAAELSAPWPVEASLSNPWPPEWEREYQQRVRHTLEVWKEKKPGGTTSGESEKALYPAAMFAFLDGGLLVQAGDWTFTSRIGAEGRAVFRESRR